jgi:hypothetical protein
MTAHFGPPRTTLRGCGLARRRWKRRARMSRRARSCKGPRGSVALAGLGSVSRAQAARPNTRAPRWDAVACLNNGRANNAHYSLEPTEWTGRSMAPERIWLLSNRARLSRGCPPLLLPCLFLRLLRDAALCDHRRWLVHGPYRKRF